MRRIFEIKELRHESTRNEIVVRIGYITVAVWSRKTTRDPFRLESFVFLNDEHEARTEADAIGITEKLIVRELLKYCDELQGEMK